ncbi:uncharacterized protein LOC135401115 [Ornithodoros turicata]|uniref:uncharacterized protein LOC135401115 n=1 Tax=Ornithodoros turicata TaxID=34597 RepID=UPI00313960E8
MTTSGATGRCSKQALVASKEEHICGVCSYPADALVSLCDCKGFIGANHKTCLARWLKGRNVDRCNVCQGTFKTGKSPKPVAEFFKDPENKTDVLRMVVTLVSCLGDVMIMVLAWRYASRKVFGKNILLSIIVTIILLLQSLFWTVIFVVRIWICYAPFQKWRLRTTSIDMTTTAAAVKEHVKSPVVLSSAPHSEAISEYVTPFSTPPGKTSPAEEPQGKMERPTVGPIDVGVAGSGNGGARKPPGGSSANM